MSDDINTHDPSRLDATFLEEYNSDESIRRYTGKSAGHGISYLLDHDYGKIYLEAVEKHVPKARLKAGIRLWEFGCGGGMNLLHLVSTLKRSGIPVDLACGTDFSGTLIGAAKGEVNKLIPADQVNNVRFAVARNENLIEEGANELGVGRDTLVGSFDLVFGVNTIRYGHRLNNVDRCVEDIRGLLRTGGVCIVIDMNSKFPAFRSRFCERPADGDQKATLLPTLEEYASPFCSAGFEILKKENFCWIPHSAGVGLTMVMRALTPFLNAVARHRGMRSLVISRKVS